MPPRKGKQGKDEEYDEGFEIDPEGRPAKDSYAGIVLKNGKYQCTLYRWDKTGTEEIPCTSIMANTSHSISSHNSKLHKNGAYAVHQAKEEPLPCPHCDEYVGANHHSLISHVRKHHGHRNESHSVIQASIAKRHEQKLQKAKMRSKDGEEEESLFVSDDSPSRDQSPDGGRGPGAGSVGPIPAT
ncbi:hypothetical protein GGR53DRAFT_465825 [Hypoxylon sp. FL1150]|nr:hypothetical protein GGR53DRAFT_465825 [Hypoxylon sp. FL1150]